MISAELTNAATNALHALLLLLYFASTLRLRMRGNPGIGTTVVAFFGIVALMKLMGVYVHYAPDAGWTPTVWAAISLLVVVLNHVVLRGLRAPLRVQMGMALGSFGCSVFFVMGDRDFLLIAIPVLLVYAIAARYSRSALRLGFLLVVASNMIWIASRQIGNALAGGELPAALRYDNDLYHLLLMGATFVLYRAAKNGEWAAMTPTEGTRGPSVPSTCRV